MGAVGLVFAALLATVAPGGGDEHVLIDGRLRVTDSHGEVSGSDSRRFEVTLSRRQGHTISVQACIFADWKLDGEWQGVCFAIQPYDLRPLEQVDFARDGLASVDKAAQHLLRTLVVQGNPHLNADRRIIGYDPEAPLGVHVASFAEADL